MSEESSGWRVVEASGETPPDSVCIRCFAPHVSTVPIKEVPAGLAPHCVRCNERSVMHVSIFGGEYPDEDELRWMRYVVYRSPEDAPSVPPIRIQLNKVFASMEARAAGGVGEIDEETCRAAMAEMGRILGVGSNSGDGAEEVAAGDPEASAPTNDGGDDA